SRSPFTSAKLLIHANILDSLIQDDGIVLAPRWVDWATTVGFTLFVFWAVLKFSPLLGVFATLGSGFVLLVGGLALFNGMGEWNGIWIRLSQPLVGIFLGYYLVVPYRLIREYKKRWDYQRRNQILTQV